MKTQTTNKVSRQPARAMAEKNAMPFASLAIDLYDATRTLFRAFHYLKPRMKGGDLAPPAPMNGEALAGCILHACMSRLVREMKQARESEAVAPDWFTRPSAMETVSEHAR
jgi:hypothetical protein